MWSTVPFCVSVLLPTESERLPLLSEKDQRCAVFSVVQIEALIVYVALATVLSVYVANVPMAFTVCVVETVMGVEYVLVVPPEQR